MRRLLCWLGLHNDIVEVIDRLKPTAEDVALGRLALYGRVKASHTACRTCGRRC